MRLADMKVGDTFDRSEFPHTHPAGRWYCETDKAIHPHRCVYDSSDVPNPRCVTYCENCYTISKNERL